LVQRGVTLSVASLATALATRTLLAAPAGLSARVSDAAMARVASGVGFASLLLKLMTPAKIMVPLAVLVAAVIVTPWAVHHRGAGSIDQSGESSDRLAPGEIGTRPSRPSDRRRVAPGSNSAAVDGPAAAVGKLVLSIVVAESGKPLPNVPIDYRGWEGGKFTGQKLV